MCSKPLPGGFHVKFYRRKKKEAQLSTDPLVDPMPKAQHKNDVNFPTPTTAHRRLYLGNCMSCACHHPSVLIPKRFKLRAHRQTHRYVKDPILRSLAFGTKQFLF